MKTDEQGAQASAAEETAKKTTRRGRPATKARTAKGSAVDGESDGAPATTKKKPTRRKAELDVSSAPHRADVKAVKKATRRSARLSEEDAADDVALAAHERRGPGRAAKAGQDADRPPRRFVDSSPITQGGAAAAVQSAKIALPMSDTPVINRNKEMRKKGGGNRRSSLGTRGRRASSLIDSGQTAIPHREVDPSHFYKHIEAEGLPEPRRMKQLLTWCSERALSEKPPHGSHDASVVLGGACFSSPHPLQRPLCPTPAVVL